MSSPEDRIIRDIRQYEQANTMHDRLLEAHARLEAAEDPILREGILREFDMLLDISIEKRIVRHLGNIAAERTLEKGA